jgi:ADP-ribose pyrophosphatase YjhB (NUDIX family)
MREETSLHVDVGPVIEVFERIHREGGRLRYHFVIIDYLCSCTGGDLCAGDDAEDAVWVTSEELEQFGIRSSAVAVIRKGLAMSL